MNANPSKKSPTSVTDDPQELEHEIRVRAQQLYEEGGREGANHTPSLT